MNQILIKSIQNALKLAKTKGMTFKELSMTCKVKSKMLREFRECLRYLTAKGIVTESKLRIYHKDYLTLTKGVVTRLNKTFGFVRLDDETDVFIPGKFFMGAIPGDTVMVAPIKSRGEKPEGEVVKILQEGDGIFTGTLCEDDGEFFVSPDTLMRFDMPISSANIGAANNGDKVMCRIIERGSRHSDHKIAVVSAYGSSESAYNCAQAVLDFNNISITFPDDVLAEARKLDPDIIPKEDMNYRLDLRNEIIFTIDGADTKDIDDAISVKKNGDMFELGVHIADVSHYVTTGSKLDDEAFNRGTSIYFADRVVPMLPPELSNGICSLNERVDRLAFSCIMTVSAEGKLVDFDFKKTIINSRVKGVYSEINQILSGEEDDIIKQKYDGLYKTITLMEELADILTKNKRERGAPEIETVESKIVLNEHHAAIDVIPRTRGKSEVLIEEFMLMANEAAASMAKLKEIPFVYRVHEPPSEQKITALCAALDALGIDNKEVAPGVPAAELSRLINDARDKKYYPVVNTLVLRSMSKARYFDQPLGHYGLALTNYAQFTSPIRRYPDLTIHRILSDVVKGTPIGKVRSRYEKFAVASSRRSTETELAAMRLERSCDDCYKAEYMKAHIGEVFDGIISSVAFHGIYVALPNSIEGLVKIQNLPEGEYQYDEMFTMKNILDNKAYSIGDEISVKCISVNVSDGNVDFAVV